VYAEYAVYDDAEVLLFGTYVGLIPDLRMLGGMRCIEALVLPYTRDIVSNI
jgi:hypothetical protein